MNLKGNKKLLMSKIQVIIPYNEEKLLHTLWEIPDTVEIIIISNNSTDNTIKVATEAGATVLSKTEGYGYACLKGMEYISNQEIKPDIVVFWMEIILSDVNSTYCSYIRDNIDFVDWLQSGPFKRKFDTAQQERQQL
jgi:glycosyltransferase involved in cell wall biosynthesis